MIPKGRPVRPFSLPSPMRDFPFPAAQQGQIRTQLSLVLEGILTQTLLPRADGRGRVLSMEVLVPTPAIRNLIREDKIHQIYSSMQTSQEKTGMQTFNQSLAALVFKRLITQELALSVSHNPQELSDMFLKGQSSLPAHLFQAYSGASGFQFSPNLGKGM